MISRRRFVTALSALPLAGLLNGNEVLTETTPAEASPVEKNAGENFCRHVKLSIGTGGHGHTYPGATVPFGMVQLSPDTFNDGWDWCSGYHYSDGSIMGFSHTHLSGTGGADMLDVLLMPGTGPAKTVPGSRQNPGEGYRSRFSHEEEIAEPGYYAVTLRDYDIRAELSATERAGMHRYTFPRSDSSHFMLDLVHAAGNAEILWANLKVVGQDTLMGGRGVKGWASGRNIYFALKFSKPFESVEIFSNEKRWERSGDEAEGPALKCLTHFKTARGERVLVKVGLSGVSADGALRNLDAEIPGWDFERVRSQAHAVWNRHLARVKITTGNERHKRIFYTALYHTMVAPTLFDDTDGQYRGMDGKVHRVPGGMHNYSTFSLWDTYRAAHPLYTLVAPERVPDFVNCLVRMADESPDGVPIWPLQGKETFCMTGYHSSSVVAEAITKKFPGIDVAKAYEVFRKRAMHDTYRGLGYYRRLGFIPCDKEDESVSKTMEYAYNDWAVARLAEAAGQTEDAQVLLERCKNYRNLFDKRTGFARPKLENGAWAEPFEPTEMGHSKQWRDYTESDPWETTFTVQHDPAGLIELFGGRQQFLEKLDALFTASSQLPPDAPPDIAGMVGQYAHGNEPCHHMAYLYCYAGAAHQTQDRVRRLLELEYDDQPDGLAGNEDCGQMSAWYVLSALGFYPVDPVSGRYVLGTPLFDRAEITLDNGKKLVVEARRSSPDEHFVQFVVFNGQPHHRLWFAHRDIANGGSLVFTMGKEPGSGFGAGPEALPPSLGA